jgi:uncharacterized protein (TIGR02996 family)
MSDADALLAAIRAAPDDDAPRLIYADWLDEHGQPERAEFIRLQCQLATLPQYSPERQILEKREQELLRVYRSKWSQAIAPIARDVEFHRGFVDTVAVGARKFVTHGDTLFDLEPIRNIKLLRLGSSAVTAAEFAKARSLSRIRGLTLQGNLDADGLRDLIALPGLKQLTALCLEGTFDGDGLEPIYAGRLPALESLRCDTEVSVVSEANLQRLVNSKGARSLKHLNLQHHNLKVAGVQAIAKSKYLKELVSLRLKHCAAGLGGTQALADAPNCRKLMVLDLRGNRLTDSAVRAIAESTQFDALQELYLGMNDIGPEGARILANWPGLSRLRVLHLYSCQIGDDGARALAASPHAANLWRLDVTMTGTSQAGDRALAESPFLKNAIVGSCRPD